MADSKKYNGSTWEHSLRKLTTATADIEPTIYTDGTAITAYTIKGNTVQSGTPTPSNPVDVNSVGVRTENLLDYNTFVNDYWLNNNTGLPQPYNNGGRIATTSSIDVNNVNNVTFNFTSGVANTQFMYSLFNGSTLIERVTGLSREATIDVSNGDTLYLCLYRTTGLPITISDVSNAMLNIGSTAKPFEPNGYKIPILKDLQTLTSIYLNEPLMGIATADTLSSSGTITRAYTTVVLDSNTIVNSYTTRWGNAFQIPIANVPIGGGAATIDAVCSHYPIKTRDQIYSADIDGLSYAGANNYVVINDVNCSTTQDFKDFIINQYNANTPITIVIAVTTPTTESVTAPSIPTTEGANTITVDTTVQPSEFSATWTGWHNAEVKEKSENLFDASTAVDGYEITGLNITPNANWYVSDYIPVQVGNTYIANGTGGSCILYDANKTLISSATTLRSTGVTIDTGIAYMRINGAIVNKATAIVNLGTTALPYEPYWK